MKHLNKPTFDVKEIVNNCAESYKDKQLKNNFITSSEFIKSESAKYDLSAQHGEWDIFKQHDMVNNILTKENMKSLYNDKFVGNHEIKSKYYDKIMVSTTTCPICGIGQVSNLDHYLAKSLYPTYSVTPINLIPICRVCNYEKRDDAITNIKNAPLNPYYDDVDNIIWLKASLKLGHNALNAIYSVNNKLQTTDNTLYYRMQHHLNIYKLPTLYTSQASMEIAEHTELWKSLLQKNKNRFKKHLQDSLHSYEKIQKNTWKTALYRALIENFYLTEQYLS